MSFQPPVKDLLPSIKLIQDLLSTRNYTVEFPDHYLDKHVFLIKKEGKQYIFDGSSKIQKGVQTNKEIEFLRGDLVILKDDSHTLYVEGKYILLNKIDYDEEKYLKLFSGSINSFSSSASHADINHRCLRMIIPDVDKNDFSLHGFRHLYFTVPPKTKISYLPVIFQDTEYHLYQCSISEKKYLIIDCGHQETLVNFQKKCFNTLLTYGFITGNLIHDECFILSFADDKMATPVGFLFHSMRSSVITNQAVFTSNPFSVNSDIDFEREEDGRIKESVLKKLNEGMEDFPVDVFSKLAELFFKEEKLQRAALLFIQSHITSLEMQIPNYFVAVEAITGYISASLASSKKSLAPIKDPDLATQLIEYVNRKALELKEATGLDDTEFNMDILRKNINKLNAPPNADKLAQSFTFLGYHLSPEQNKILKDRNTFLHGSFLKTIDDDGAFREALHVALRVRFLIAVAILKLAGFSGKVINYAELWSHITEKELHEERLVSI